jgi:hypothetical protein
VIWECDEHHDYQLCVWIWGSHWSEPKRGSARSDVFGTILIKLCFSEDERRKIVNEMTTLASSPSAIPDSG